ncbi:hypothetical protein [Thalassotalea sp. PS06]|nr:hypothetical protein [Thalassotalea sp. PS06]
MPKMHKDMDEKPSTHSNNEKDPNNVISLKKEIFDFAKALISSRGWK